MKASRHSFSRRTYKVSSEMSNLTELNSA